nr:hypothetical protein [uncultured Roseateles sp.]
MSEPKDSSTQVWASEMEVILGQVSSEPVVAVAVAGSGEETREPPVAKPDPDAALREAYPAALLAAEVAQALLTQPAISVEALRIKTELIEAAKAKAATGDHVGAMGLLGQVQAACLAAQVAADKYLEALRVATEAQALLTRPAIVVDGLRVKTELIEGAKARAATGDYVGAMGLLGQVQAACLAAQSEADKYADALSTAEAELRKLDQPVSRRDAAQIQKDLITAAAQKVAADRAGAIELLGQVTAACASAHRDADRYVAALRAAETAVGLLVHPALVKDAEKITSDFITAAKAKAANGDRSEAMALLGQVAAACEAAKQEGGKYDRALLAANEAVALLVQPVVKNEVLHIKTTLIEAAKTQVSATGDRAGALSLLGQVTAACAAAQQIADKYAAALQLAEDAAAALTHAVVAPEVALLKTETIEAAKTAANVGDSGTAMSLLAQAVKRCQLAKVHTQRYVDGLALADNNLTSVATKVQGAITYWAPNGHILGLSDVLPDIRTSNIEAAKTQAAAGAYVDAMALLEAVGGRVQKAMARGIEFMAFVKEFRANEALLATANLTFNTLVGAPAIATRLANLQANVISAGKTRALTGDYAGALDIVKTFGTQHSEVQAMLTQHQQFDTDWAAAEVRVNSLSHGDVALDKDRITAARLTAAKVKVTAGDYPAALGLLAKVDGECTVIADYGSKLTAAKAAVALLVQPAVAGDKARIQRERIDAALALAATWDYAGAVLLLGKVAAECDAAKAVVSGTTEAAAANALAQGPIGAVKTAPEPAFKAVEDMVAALDGLGDVIKDDREAIRTTIALARAAVAKPDEGGDPKALLEAAANACVVARGVADRHAQYLLALADAEAQLISLADPVIAADKAKIKLDRIDKAKEGIKPPARDYAGALAELAKVQAECEAAKAVLAQDVAYKSALTAANLKVATLTEALIAADKLGIETDLIAAAATKVGARLYADAMDLLAKVGNACEVAKKVVADELAYQAKLGPAQAALAKLRDLVTRVESATSAPRPTEQAIITDAQTNHVDAAEALALTRGYDAAMALLAGGSTKVDAATADILDLVAANILTTKAGAALATLEAHGGVDGVAAELVGIRSRNQHGRLLRNARKYAAARQIGQEVQWACAAATKIAVLHDAYAPKLATSKARMVTCASRVGGLSPAVAAISEKLKEVQTRFVDAAEAYAKGREYAGATGLLDQVDAKCAAVELLVTQHGLYVAALAAAESELIPLTQPVVAGDVERIRKDRIDAAKTLVAALDYTAALALLAKVKAECDAAAAVVAGNAAVAKGGEDAKKLLDGTPEGNTAALIEVEKLLKALTERHAARAAIKDRTDLIEQALVTARTLAPAAAKPKIEAIADQCVASQEVGDRHVEYGKLLLAAEALVNGLTEPSMATDKAKITLDRIEAAKAKALLHDYRSALGLLDPVAAECTAARTLAAEFDLYSSDLVAAQSTLDGLNALTPVLDPQIGADVQKISDECIAAAKTLALPATRDYAGARKLLAKLDSRCKTAALKKSMLGGTDPSKGDIDSILLMDGGKKLLDDVIASLPATTPRSVVQAAIQARFNVELKNYTKEGALKPGTEQKAASLKKLYELMTKVPDTHTEGIKIDRYGGKSGEKLNKDRGSFYRSSETKVVLSCGRAKDADVQPLANIVFALPDLEPDCELVPDGPTSPAPKYFDWTSLHELGHAIDDKKQFMAGKEGDGEFGGWVTYGRDVLPIATAAAAKFNFPASYIAEYLLSKSGTVPTAPLGRADWDACRAKAEEWCNALRVDKELWERGSESKQRAIGDRVYHEAYAGDWVSYNVAARSKGVTGYQFRAPGEWLSELYAAHRMEKLKPSHPANAWLATL